MGILRFLFAPEIGRALGETGGASPPREAAPAPPSAY